MSNMQLATITRDKFLQTDVAWVCRAKSCSCQCKGIDIFTYYGQSKITIIVKFADQSDVEFTITELTTIPTHVNLATIQHMKNVAFECSGGNRYVTAYTRNYYDEVVYSSGMSILNNHIDDTWGIPHLIPDGICA